MTNEELLSKTITALRFPLIVGVVFIHNNLASGLTVNGVTHGLDLPGWYFFIVNITSGTFASITVPLFFIFSGYLFFYGCEFDNTVYTRKLKSRFYTLFIPYILWNLIPILWQLKSYLPIVSSDCSPAELHFSFVRIINTFFCLSGNNGIFVHPELTDTVAELPYPINMPLWYLRDLMLMVVVSPVIYYLVRRFKFLVVAIIALVWVLSPVLFSVTNYFGQQLIVALLFFTWGGYLGIQKQNLVTCFRKYNYIPYIYICIAVIDALTKQTDYNFAIHRLGIFLGIITFVVVGSVLVERGFKANKFLSNSSFFIYASHIMILSALRQLLFTKIQLADGNPFLWLVFYLIIPVITVAICLIMMIILKKLSPRLLSLLNGGR